MTGAARWFVAAGSSCVVVGGLVAAATGPTGFEDGSWVAAYLVLVGGVAQIALGVGQQLVGALAVKQHDGAMLPGQSGDTELQID